MERECLLQISIERILLEPLEPVHLSIWNRSTNAIIDENTLFEIVAFKKR